MSVPFHPFITHLPIALTLVLPFLVVAFALMIRSKKMSTQAWLIIIGLQIVTTVTGYIALESGETEEVAVSKVVDRKIINEHEQAAEVFVGVTVIMLVLSCAIFFIPQALQFKLQLVVAGIGLLSGFLALDTGKLGGALTYTHGAAAVYVQVKNHSDESGLLPTPGKNTSESSYPVEENESLKSDENDYGNGDEGPEADDEDAKIED